MKDNIDYKEICVSIAKKHPKIFVTLSNKTDWMIQAKALMVSGEKVQAIKYVRNIKGVGLKEAKDMVEALV